MVQDVLKQKKDPNLIAIRFILLTTPLCRFSVQTQNAAVVSDFFCIPSRDHGAGGQDFQEDASGGGRGANQSRVSGFEGSFEFEV